MPGCAGGKICEDGECMIVDKDLLDYDNLAVQTSVTSEEYIGQTWTASASGQLVEIRVIGHCPSWPDTYPFAIAIEGVKENGWPDAFRMLATSVARVVETRGGLDNDQVVIYSFADGPRFAVGDELGAVFVVDAGCHLATTTANGAVGLWTAGNTGDWVAVNGASLRFMVLLRP
jgi:hypothetical protein